MNHSGHASPPVTNSSSPTRSLFLARILAACLGSLLLAQTGLSAEPRPWSPLFNGQDLAGWQVNDFGGAGEVTVDQGKIVLQTGVALTGLRRTNVTLRSHYEVSLEAMKIDGGDFFCGLTFPVKDSHATLIVGGWGGSLVGFSSVDGMDASENEFTQYMKFETNRWYDIRLRVTDRKIQAWINRELMIDAWIEGRRISMRPGEIEAAAPFGLATYQTTAAFRNLQVRPTPEKIPSIAFIAGKKSHGPGEHEYRKSLELLQKTIQASHDFVDTRVYFDGWPSDPDVLSQADSIVVFCDGADRAEVNHPLIQSNRLTILGKLMERGVGLGCLHYTLFVPAERGGKQFLEWLGGYFDYETGSGPNRWYSKIETREFDVFPAVPDHPAVRDLKPFRIQEEFYFHLRFAEDARGLTPLLTLDPEKKDRHKVVAWALERANGGRSFGFSGGHFYQNFQHPDFQKFLINAILWSARAASDPRQSPAIPQ